MKLYGDFLPEYSGGSSAMFLNMAVYLGSRLCLANVIAREF